MSFNKAKAQRNAERYLTQGKIQAAIGEYRQIVDHDPKDVNTQNMLGDLYVKSNNSEEAVNCYRRVADYYNGQGFAKKAIAVYNKIFRIKPDSMEISSRLAELYRIRGAFAEAKNHYEKLANHFEGKGKKVEALAMWENIADLDPRNADIYLKIAESYWQDSREQEASEAFVKAGHRLADANNHESAVTAFSRALEITPLDNEAMEGLVKSQIELGYPEEAAKALEKRIEDDPYDKDTNFLLVDCYYDMDEPASAERVIVKMVERDPSNYRKFLDLVDIYLKADDLDSAVRVLSMITEHMLVGGEHDALLVLLEEVLARNPEHLSALRLLTRYHGWLKDEIELKAALERVVESARINGSEEDEQFALSKLVLLVPHDREIAERLAELGGEPGHISFEPVGQSAEQGEVPNFQSYAVLSDDGDTDAGIAIDQNPNPNGTEGSVVQNSDVVVSEASAEDTLEAEIVTEYAADGQVPAMESETLKAIVSEEFAVGADSVDTAKDVISKESAEPPPLTAADEMRLEEEIESISFYIDQGYNGLADKSLSEIERDFGARPEIVSLRTALGGESHVDEFQAGEVAAVENSVVQNDSEAATEPEQPEKAPEESFDSEAVSESEFEVEVSARQENVDSEFDDQPRAIDPSGHASVPLDEKEEEAPLDEMATSSKDGDSEVQNGEEFHTINEPAPLDESAAAGDEDKTESSISYENFRHELGLGEAESTEDDDYENHYHHAVAYQEMGLMEEAIREFQDAVNSVAPNDGTHRFLNCCTLLGHCFMEKGMPNLSVVWFERAFESAELTAEEMNGLYYELANAHEADGDLESAIAEFEKIYGVDVDFRDVGDRIEKLRAMAPTSA